MRGIHLGWKYWAVEIFMVALAAYNFWLAALRWGFQDADATVAVGAVILAAATEIGLVVFLHMQRAAIYAERKNWSIAWWVLLSAGCIAVSLYVNQLYFRAHWHDVDGNVVLDQWIRSLWPMILMVGAACVSPKALRSVEEIAREYDVKVYEAQRQQELAATRDQRKVAQRQQDEATRRNRWTRNNDRLQMRELADEALLRECEDEDGDLDYALLDARLREAGKWPIVRPDAQEEPSDPNMDAITPAGMPKWLTAEQVAETLDISVYQATQRMKADYKGRYSRIKSREFIVQGKPVRKAYYKTVDEIKPKGIVQSDTQEKVQVAG